MSEQAGDYQTQQNVLNNITSPLMILNSDRIWLAKLFRSSGFKQGVEVGTGSGEYAEQL